MSSDLHSGFPDATCKPVLRPHLLGWVKARFRDIMTVADVLHDLRWTAPWDEAPSPTHPDGLGNADRDQPPSRPAKAAAIAVVGLATCAIGMGAAAGLADATLFAAKSSCAMIADAGRALNWDGGHAGLVLR
jgi:hypothetical protein